MAHYVHIQNFKMALKRGHRGGGGGMSTRLCTYVYMYICIYERRVFMYMRGEYLCI